MPTGVLSATVLGDVSTFSRILVAMDKCISLIFLGNSILINRVFCLLFYVYIVFCLFIPLIFDRKSIAECGATLKTVKLLPNFKGQNQL